MGSATVVGGEHVSADTCGDGTLSGEQEPDGTPTSVGKLARQTGSAMVVRSAPASFEEQVLDGESDGESILAGEFVWWIGSATVVSCEHASVGVCGDEVPLEGQEPDGMSTSVGYLARQIGSATVRSAPASFAERESDGMSAPVGELAWQMGSATVA